MSIPSSLHYSKDHEWIKFEGNTAVIGVTQFAVEQLGDIVHIELPELEDSFGAGDSFGTIESTKTVSDLYLPVAGTITAINDDLVSAPDALQNDVYDKGWLVKINVKDSDKSDLMSAADYEKFIAE